MSENRAKGIKQSFGSIDPYQFEKFIAELWERQGWEAEVTTESQDAGIDVLVRKSNPFNQTQVIQVKRNAPENKVSSSKIQQYASLKRQVPEADSVIVVTTSDFTSHAMDRASELNVKTINGDSLLEIIDDVDAYDLVDRYVDQPIDDTPTDETNNDDAPKFQSTRDDPSSVNSGNEVRVETDEEMSTEEAILAVGQGLLALGFILLIVFLVVRVFVF
ncbi:restriction endonuclease [Halomicroarcula sp. GCM10025817]|uniref:restriction endonuclease n=1 Tax=Haloarcula TaxID=2237 RepID=UPI0023E7ACAC|nr:restriction endonuclease [Halomicroarcula sp. SYNS111]